MTWIPGQDDAVMPNRPPSATERDGCECKWSGGYIVRLARECPRLEAHRDRLLPARRVGRILDEYDRLDYRRKRAVNVEELVATLRAALDDR